MASTAVNLITTTLLTLITGALLVVIYRTAVRPILVRHNVFPLRNLPSTISQHFDNRRNGIRLRDDDDLESAEQSFADYGDDESDDERETRGRMAPYRDEVPEAEARDGSGEETGGGASAAGRGAGGSGGGGEEEEEEAPGDGGLRMVGGALMGTGSNSR